jgi:hypothetical protein
MTPELDALVDRVERSCAIHREPNFVLVEPEPAPSNWSAYLAGLNFALRPSMTVFCILCVNL